MPYFAVNYTYVPDADALDLVRPRHRAFLSTLVGDPLVASGPFVDADQPSALLIFLCGSSDDLLATLNSDPFWQEGLIAERTISQWNPVIGSLA